MAAGVETRLWEMEEIVRMVDAYHRPEPAFTAYMAKDGTCYVLMDPNAYAPTLHIGDFASED